MLYEAVVTEVLPKVGGVRVRFRDLVPSGFGINDYVRVLCKRMSAQGGAALDLPEPGEHGVVGRMAGGTCVWLGATPFLDQNQVDPTEGIAYYRHRSGVVFQERDNGDFEIAHPSGLRFTVSADGAALPSLQATSKPLPRGGGVPTVILSHPSGTQIIITPDGSESGVVTGDVSLTASGKATISADGGADVTSIIEVTLAAPIINLNGAVTVGGVGLAAVIQSTVEGMASNLLPLVDGIASSGSSNGYARADHIHPASTSGGDGGGNGGPGGEH